MCLCLCLKLSTTRLYKHLSFQNFPGVISPDPFKQEGRGYLLAEEEEKRRGKGYIMAVGGDGRLLDVTTLFAEIVNHKIV